VEERERVGERDRERERERDPGDDDQRMLMGRLKITRYVTDEAHHIHGPVTG